MDTINQYNFFQNVEFTNNGKIKTIITNKVIPEIRVYSQYEFFQNANIDNKKLKITIKK